MQRDDRGDIAVIGPPDRQLRGTVEVPFRITEDLLRAGPVGESPGEQHAGIEHRAVEPSGNVVHIEFAERGGEAERTGVLVVQADRIPEFRDGPNVSHHRLFAAEMGIHREELREGAVVAAMVPADQIQFGRADLLTVHFTGDLSDHVEGHEYGHRRLGLRRLLRYRTGEAFHPHAEADVDCPDRILKHRVVLQFLRQKPDAPAAPHILPVEAGCRLP